MTPSGATPSSKTSWLSQKWAYRTVAWPLVFAPLAVLFLMVMEDRWGQHYFLANPALLFDCGSVISLFVGLNRFKRWLPNPLADLSGCIIAFALSSLAAVHILLLVGAISIISGGEPVEVDQAKAYVFSFYAIINLVGAIQASQRAKLTSLVST
jgi:hypothetical protein